MLDRSVDPFAVYKMLRGGLPPKPVRWARNRWGRVDNVKFLNRMAKDLGYGSYAKAVEDLKARGLIVPITTRQ